MSPTQLLSLGLAPMVMVALCAVTARAIGGDPMLGAELGLAVVVGVWLTLLARRIRPAIASSSRWRRQSAWATAMSGSLIRAVRPRHS